MRPILLPASAPLHILFLIVLHIFIIYYVSYLKEIYSNSFKLSVVTRSLQVGNRVVAREFDVDESCICR